MKAKGEEVNLILPRGLKWGSSLILASLAGYLLWTGLTNQVERDNEAYEAERMKDPAYRETVEWVKKQATEWVKKQTDSPSDVPPSQQITSRYDFYHSEFCQQFRCKEKDSWAIQNGGTNYTYSTSVDNLMVDVSTKGELVTELGLMFSERSELSDPDFAVVESLLRSTDQARQHEGALSFIKRNVEEPVPQIKKAQFTTDGPFRIWAGKVRPEQVVAFERVRP